MKKRIGTKTYNTEKSECILPAANLYKQPLKRSFFTFDGETITPLTFDQAAEILRGAGDPALLSYLEVKEDNRGRVRVAVDAEHYRRLSEYSRKTGISCSKLVESFIDSLDI